MVEIGKNQHRRCLASLGENSVKIEKLAMYNSRRAKRRADSLHERDFRRFVPIRTTCGISLPWWGCGTLAETTTYLPLAVFNRRRPSS